MKSTLITLGGIIAVLAIFVFIAIYFAPKATAIAIHNNSGNLTMQEYLEVAKKPLLINYRGSAAANTILYKKFRYVIEFEGYLNPQRYWEFYPEDGIQISGDKKSNKPSEMSGLIFTDNNTRHHDKRFFKK